ncbi:hypothetical protein [Mangrovicoccus ximenensis]|uniref:hypothetical protein n=1 Tax=Mangrovicoccus ximenensis TaxID=1911570 RepID=UPI000D35FB16|nr:hypothetical protein [Mangrovicoccus ximenensis]
MLGADPRTTPQLYYLQTDVSALDGACRTAIAAWFGEAPPYPVIVPTGPKTKVGSRRVPPDKKVAAYFRERGEAAADAALGLQRGKPSAAREVHGAFAAHAAAVLLWCLGRRPHGEVLPKLQELVPGVAHAAIRIVDKGNRSVDDGRWLPLPSLAAVTIREIRSQLDHVIAWGRMFSPQAVAYARRAQAGEVSPLFLLPDAGGTPVPLRCSEHWESAPIPRLPRNCFRHGWRSRMTRDGVAGWRIDAWMGHGGWRSAPLLSGSAFAAGDLDGIAQCIDGVAAELGITAPMARRLLP